MEGQAKQPGSYADNLRHMLRALKGRNYSLFFMGQGLSLVGTWMQNTALPLLVYQLNFKSSDLGMVGFFSAIFGFLLAPFAGVLSDRWNRRKVLLVTQSLALVQALVLAALTISGQIQVGHVMFMAAFLGVINAFDIPTRQSFVVQMVDHKEDLPNAIALNSFIFNGARLVGPLIAGVMIPVGDAVLKFRFAGFTVCFIVNAISYIAVLASLLAMRLGPYERTVSRNNIVESLKEGLSYAFHFKPIRSILLMLGAVSLLVTVYGTLLPALDAKVLHHAYAAPPAGMKSQDIEKYIQPLHSVLGFTVGYERSFAFMVASIAVGGLIGALYLSSRKSVLGLGRVIPTAAALLGLGMIGLSLSGALEASMVLLVVVGMGQMVQMASCNTLLQTIVDEDKRGRVMSFYVMAFQGTAPFGALAAGWLATALGVRHGEQIIIAIAGALIVLTAAAFATRLPSLRKHVRPVYVRMGILSPEGAPVPKAAADEDIEPDP